jgi:hypothetical protein
MRLPDDLRTVMPSASARGLPDSVTVPEGELDFGGGIGRDDDVEFPALVGDGPV